MYKKVLALEDIKHQRSLEESAMVSCTIRRSL